jgi:hypothetical protein
VAERSGKLTGTERIPELFTRLRPSEGRGVLVFFTYALLMMLSYYILKTIREPLLLTGTSAEIKSYAYAVTALLLLFIIPVYGLVFRHRGKQQMTRYITGFFLANLFIFYLAGRSGLDIGFAYYFWVGIFSVMITARQAHRETLPEWLVFDPESLCFSGTPPLDMNVETRIVLRATDFDGAWVEGELVLKHGVGPE